MGTIESVLPVPQQHELHSMLPWCVARSDPSACFGLTRALGAAKHSLEREGFESWWPTYEVTVTPPLASLPSKTRHRARLMARREVKPLLGAYFFMRRLWGDFGLGDLWQLQGVSGVCQFGEHVALIPDYEVELLRVACAKGKFDQVQVGAVQGRYPHSIVYEHLAAEREGRMIKEVDESGRLVQFFEKLGRVVQVVTSSAQATRQGTTPSAKLDVTE